MIIYQFYINNINLIIELINKVLHKLKIKNISTEKITKNIEMSKL
jgi:hypothetical protein